jgi:hypothetical protein
MVGIPRLREAGWLITGTDCRRRADEGGHVMRRYGCEADARTAVAAIYALSRHMAPLPTWDPQRCELARWRVRIYPPEPAGLARR